MACDIEIAYCSRCGWMLRATWLAQEILRTFENDVRQVSLKPDASGGLFEIRLNDKLLFSRKEAGRFPEAKEVKQLIRDQIDPERDLGHCDR